MGKTPDQIRREIEETRGRMGETVEAIGYKADVPSRAKESVTHTKDNIVGSIKGAKDRVVESIVGTKESVGAGVGGAAGSVSSTVGGTASSVSSSIGSAAGSVSDRASSLAASVSDATPGASDIKQGAQRSVGLAQENPLGLAIGAVAIGFVAGLVIPSTRKEHETLGPIADEVKGKVREAGEEALEHGKQVASEAADTARRVASEAAASAQQVASEGAEQLKSTAQEHGQQAASSVQEKAQDLTGGVGGSNSGEQSTSNSGEWESTEAQSEPSPWAAPDVTTPIEGFGGQTPPDPQMRDSLES